MSEYRGLVLDSRVYRGETEPPDTFEDESRYGNDGVHANITWVRLSSGLWVRSFNGASSNVALANYPAASPQKNISLLAWVYPTTLAGDDRFIFCQADSGAAVEGWAIGRRAASNDLLFLIACDAWETYFTGVDIDLNTWTFVAGTYDGTTMHVYKNGLDVDGVGNAATGDIDYDTGDNINIGSRKSAGDFWAGNISFPRIYNYALSPAQIYAIFNAERSLFGV